MSYRPSAKQPRGTWGRFLDRERLARDWSQQQAFEALREGLGLGDKSRASYVTLEQGREPNPDQRAFLVSYFGRAPDDKPEPPEPSLAAALSALAEELRLSRIARETDAVRLQTLEAAVALLAQQAGVELQAHVVPRA